MQLGWWVHIGIILVPRCLLKSPWPWRKGFGPPLSFPAVTRRLEASRQIQASYRHTTLREAGAVGSGWAPSPSRWVAQDPCFRVQHPLPPVSPCCLQPPKQPTHMPSNLFHLKKHAHPWVLSHCFRLTESKEEGREEELTY